MSQGYRDQFTPARLGHLGSMLLTGKDLDSAYVVIKKMCKAEGTVMPDHSFASRQMIASSYGANSILTAIVESHRKEHKKHRLAGSNPTIFILDEPGPNSPSPMHTLHALTQNCEKSEFAGTNLYDKRSLGQWLRDFERNSLPGESVTDFILRRKHQQKGNSDV